MSAAPLLSCLTVTAENRLRELRRAIDCFARQTLRDRELVIVHDGSRELDAEIASEIRRHPGADARVHREPGGSTLGELRDVAVSMARGDLICQWDDDDLNHPRRLETQLRELRRAECDFNFLTDQLHFFEPTGELFWDDWRKEPYPGCLIQGTMLGRWDLLPPYEALARGEDTRIVKRLLDAGRRLDGVAGLGYLNIYVFHGRNAWDLRHHAAISVWKRLGEAALRAREPELRRHLADYALPWDRVVMPHDSGALVIREDGRAAARASAAKAPRG